jgi:hypothetical protein
MRAVGLDDQSNEWIEWINQMNHHRRIEWIIESSSNEGINRMNESNESSSSEWKVACCLLPARLPEACSLISMLSFFA